MKISQVIQKLQELLEEAGDKEVTVYCSDENGANYHATPEFWYDGESTVVVREHWTGE
jgi:hypothetical protein